MQDIKVLIDLINQNIADFFCSGEEFIYLAINLDCSCNTT